MRASLRQVEECVKNLSGKAGGGAVRPWRWCPCQEPLQAQPSVFLRCVASPFPLAVGREGHMAELGHPVLAQVIALSPLP